ncbi:MAG: hypothetical protein ABIK92_06625 [Pseudomonadota bacterium]
MSGIPVEIKKYIRLKKTYCEYLRETKEASKLLCAIEEFDTLIDYLDSYQELNKIASAKDPDLLMELRHERDNIFKKYNGLIKLFESLTNNKIIDPIINTHTHIIDKYLKFKSTINERRLSPDFEINEEISALLETCLQILSKESLSKLFESASESIEATHKESLHQLPYRWHRFITFHDRSILEQYGIFRVNQLERHILFADMAKRETTQDDKNIDSINKGFWNKLRAYLFSYKNNNSKVALDSIYETKELDEYLFVRDMRSKLLQKFGRSIPLNMNNFIIRFYNESHFWDWDHFNLENIDYLRLGFAYFQYAMELGHYSEYVGIIYRNALKCFNNYNLILPPDLTEELGYISYKVEPVNLIS